MTVPNITDSVSGATVNLTNGCVYGISTVERDKNITVSFSGTTAHIKASVHFKELKAKFTYSIKTLLLYTDPGIMDATIKNVIARVNIDYRLDDFTLTNPKLQIESFESIEVSMKSESYIIRLQNLVANNVLPFYEKKVLQICENTALQVANKTIYYINNNMSQVLADGVFILILKSYNYFASDQWYYNVWP